MTTGMQGNLTLEISLYKLFINNLRENEVFYLTKKKSIHVAKNNS